jgi:hypothetical protein
VDGVAWGDWAFVAMRAWDTQAGATYEEAVLAGYGYGSSATLYIQLGTSPTAPAGPLVGLQSFCLVPEPGTGALLAAGAAAGALTRAGRRRG